MVKVAVLVEVGVVVAVNVGVPLGVEVGVLVEVPVGVAEETTVKVSVGAGGLGVVGLSFFEGHPASRTARENKPAETA